MDWTKFSISTLIWGIAYFFLGWLIFGILLRDLTALPADISAVIEIPPEQFKISFMIISCFVMGGLHSLILGRWAGVSTFMGGLKVSAIVGVLITLSVGLGMSSMYKMNSLDQILINMVGDAVCSGLAGGLVGWYLGRGK